MIGRTNVGGGSGDTGATLVVSAPADVTVTATKDNKTYTRIANSDGVATFKGLSSGTWALSIFDSSHDPTTPVDVIITADYYATLVFFSATINITYPAGSACKVVHTDGTELYAPDTSGTWTCIVPSAGTWTVMCYDGADYDSSENKKSEVVEITSEGQSESVTLSYAFMLFDNGDQFLTVTGGWAVQNGSNSDASIKSDSIYIGCKNTSSSGQAHSAYTVNKVALNGYKTLKADISVTLASSSNTIVFGASSTQNRINNSFVASIKISTTDLTTFSVDISSINTDSYYVLFEGGYTKATIKKVWLE